MSGLTDMTSYDAVIIKSSCIIQINIVIFVTNQASLFSR